MKRSPFWLVILLFVLIAVVGCKDSPEIDPGNQGTGNGSSETVVHDAYSKGLSIPFIDGKDTTGITLTVTLDNDNKFKDVKIGDDVTRWFENTIYGLTAKITEVNSGITSKSTENEITSITIGFSGTPKSAPQKISITIPAEKLVERDKPLGVVIEGQVYEIRFGITGADGYKSFTQKVKAGNKIENPDTTEVGYRVDEWSYSDINNNTYQFDIDTIITQDYYLEGAGTAIRTVTFEYYNGRQNKVIITKGSLVNEPTDVERSGYKFDGWYLDDAEFDFTQPIVENISLKGKWLNVNSTITINWHVGKDVIKNTIGLGEVITSDKIPEPQKESIADEFEYWTTDTTEKPKFDFSKKVYETLDLYPVWKELNIGDTFILKDEYIGKNEDLKNNGIELVIIAKRGHFEYYAGGLGLDKDFEYKYIAVDKNHDLSFYVNGSDYVSYNGYGEQYENSSSDYLACTYWAPELLETGGRGTAPGTGLQNTKCALALNGTLFNNEGRSEDVQFLWSWFVRFRNQINHSNQDLWFVPSLDELSLIQYVNKNYRNRLVNWATVGEPLYWTSTEINKQIFIGSAPVQHDKYVCAYYNYNGYINSQWSGPFAEYKNHKNNQKTAARTRLCRVL